MGTFWKRKRANESTGATQDGESAAVVAAHGNKKTLPKLNKKVLLVVGVLVVGLAASAFVYRDDLAGLLGIGKTPEETDGRLTGITQSNDVVKLVEQYGADTKSTSEQVRNTKVANWSKADLDKAYFNLLYADKTSSFADVYAWLSRIEVAKNNGVNIDDNSYEIDQAKRDVIRKRADALAKQAKKNREVSN